MENPPLWLEDCADRQSRLNRQQLKCKCVLTSAGRRHHPKLWGYVYTCVCVRVCVWGAGYMCNFRPPDRTLLSIPADPSVQLRAYKQPGNDGVLQLLQQHQLISIHIRLWKPLMPIFVSHTLALSQISSCSSPHEQLDQCPNLWWGLWPLFSLSVLLLSWTFSCSFFLLLFGRWITRPAAE